MISHPDSSAVIASVGANVALFYEIRNAVIEGVFDGSGLTYYSLGNGSYKLVRE